MGAGVRVVVMPACRLSQALDVGELSGLRGVGKVCRKLVELIGQRCVPAGLGSLRGAFQIRRDLLSDLLILRRVRLLELLKFAQEFGDRGELSDVLRRGLDGGRCGAV